MSAPIRLTVVQTHPTQYHAPWYRSIAKGCPELELTVLYATVPSAEQQGAEFARPFQWDRSLTDGYRHRIVRAARPGDELTSASLFGLDVPEIASAIVESRPQVCLVPGWHSITLLRALGVCRWRGIPLLYRGDTWDVPTGLTGIARRLRTRLLLRMFSAHLSVGQRAREYLRTLGVDEARVFDSPHAVDNQWFASAAAPHQTPEGRASARKRFGLNDDAFVVLFVGKLAAVIRRGQAIKRPLDLVHAAARLGGSIRLLFVGDGELRERAREEADRLGVDARWAGFLNQSELGEAYAVADCLALPSQRESWGLVVNEALATGLPCVVADSVGCAPDLVTPGETGEIFAAGDIEALAGALDRLRAAKVAGHDFAPACRVRAAQHSFAAATEGLVSASRAVARPNPRAVA